MQDMIPAGTGNSRFLKSVSNFLAAYPTYADFAAALVAGTLPVDFNGTNPAGITQAGTPLNKSNMLTDAVAAAIAALTGTTPDTPNEALNELAAAFGKAAIIETVDYDGTLQTSKTVTFTEGVPDIVIVYQKNVYGTYTILLSPMYKDSTIDALAIEYPFSANDIYRLGYSWNDNTVTWSGTTENEAFNGASQNHYTAIGIRLGA